MSGRISDIEALDDGWTTVLVASASGGVWKSTHGGDSRAPGFRGNEELINLVALQDVESYGSSLRACDARIGKRRLQSGFETRQGASLNELRRNDLRMRLMPAFEP
jgi:hypothetical protein